MAMVPLTLESLNDLDDGRVSVAFMLELKRAVADCQDRPGDKNARTVTLDLKLTPIVDDDGSCDGAHGEFHIKSKVPQRKSKPYQFEVRKGGHLVYNSNNAENPEQTTLDDLDPATGRVRRQPKE